MNGVATRALILLRGLFVGGVSLLVVVWAVATVTFLLMRAIPGGPLSRDRQLPQLVREAIEQRYHLNDSVWIQYGRYLADAATLRFGLSYDDPGRTVGEIIAQRFPVSVLLGVFSLGLALAMAFPLGMLAAARGGWMDRLNAFVAALGVAVPSFILAATLLYIFSYRLRWFPSSGWSGPVSLVLPGVALAALPTAYLARLIRSELTEVMNSDFIRTARAKGLSDAGVLLRHSLYHVTSPVLAYLGPHAAAIMTGSFVIEQIFNIPGLGQYFVTSISNRNYPMIMGVTLFYTVILVSFNIISDGAARWLDPRTRHPST